MSICGTNNSVWTQKRIERKKSQNPGKFAWWPFWGGEFTRAFQRFSDLQLLGDKVRSRLELESPKKHGTSQFGGEAQNMGTTHWFIYPIFDPACQTHMFWFTEAQMFLRLVDPLVGGFNPSEKWSQNESSPGRGENKKCLKPPPSPDVKLKFSSERLPNYTPCCTKIATHRWWFKALTFDLIPSGWRSPFQPLKGSQITIPKRSQRLTRKDFFFKKHFFFHRREKLLWKLAPSALKGPCFCFMGAPLKLQDRIPYKMVASFWGPIHTPIRTYRFIQPRNHCRVQSLILRAKPSP